MTSASNPSKRVTRSASRQAAAAAKAHQIQQDKESPEPDQADEADEPVCDDCRVRPGTHADFRYLPQDQQPQHSGCRKCGRHYWFTTADSQIKHPNEVVGEDICYACVAIRKSMPLMMGLGGLGGFRFGAF